MKFSVIYNTFRPGAFDMLADSLVNQTYQDYELIVVDDYAGDRRGIIEQYLKDKGVKVKYVGKSKPKCFPETSLNLINAWNTGVLASTGSILVFVQDYTWLEPEALEHWLTLRPKFNSNVSVSGVARYWCEPKDRVKDLTDPISVWKEPWRGSPKENGCENYVWWVGNPLEMFYFAVPYKLLKKMNGFDENGDRDPARYVVRDYTEQVKKSEGKTMTDKTCICDMVHHKNWAPTGLWRGMLTGQGGGISYTFNLKKRPRGKISWE